MRPDCRAGDAVDRKMHYEAAFESYLQAKAWPYVAVDEAKKAAFGIASLKSFDFVVYSEAGPNLLVEVKGRKFPNTAGGRRSGRAWENWVTRDDVDSMAQWQEVFGAGFVGMLVFAYWLQGPAAEAPFEDVHFFRGRYYAFVGIRCDRYVSMAKPRSPRWQTMTVPTRQFSREAADIVSFL